MKIEMIVRQFVCPFLEHERMTFYIQLVYFQPKMHVGCGGDKKDESSWSPPTKFLLSIWKKGYDFFTRGPSYTMMELENRMMLTTSIQVPAAVSPI
jgi:hypothetical protein